MKKRLKETLIEKIFGFVFDIFHRIRYFIRIIRGNELYFHKEIKVKKELFGNTGAEWCLVPDYLNERSIIYSFGVGTDISFDLQVIKRIGCMVFAFDPTPRSIECIKNQALPSEFKLHLYVDKEKMFERALLNAVSTLIAPLGWKAIEQSSLEDFFG